MAICEADKVSTFEKNVGAQLGKLKIEACGDKLELIHMNKWFIYKDNRLVKKCG